MQRHTFFKGIPCIADENHLSCRRQRHHPEQRHTISREISCVAKEKTTFSYTSLPRHTFFKGIPCIADENHLCSRRQRHLNTPSRAATHLFQRKTLYRERKSPLLQTEPLPNTPLRAATHHFPQNFLCRERGNVVFVKPPSR